MKDYEGIFAVVAAMAGIFLGMILIDREAIRKHEREMAKVRLAMAQYQQVEGGAK